ncbi:MAG TPA: hypothetical protein PKM26_01975 [Syntrophorhabdaceae bacterium]|nr:hypothetical protein [Syntrophorhabdaceae bacterium]
MQPYGRASTSTAWQAPSIYKWKRQLSAGINASLKNTKPVKSPCLKKPEEVILRQSSTITSLKKEMDPD